MSLNIQSNDLYETLKDHSHSNHSKLMDSDAHSLENERIETVMIKINSTSSAFQIRVMLTF